MDNSGLQQIFPASSTSCCELVSRWETLVGSKGLCELDVWHFIAVLKKKDVFFNSKQSN